MFYIFSGYYMAVLIGRRTVKGILYKVLGYFDAFYIFKSTLNVLRIFLSARKYRLTCRISPIDL